MCPLRIFWEHGHPHNTINYRISRVGVRINQVPLYNVKRTRIGVLLSTTFWSLTLQILNSYMDWNGHWYPMCIPPLISKRIDVLIWFQAQPRFVGSKLRSWCKYMDIQSPRISWDFYFRSRSKHYLNEKNSQQINRKEPSYTTEHILLDGLFCCRCYCF